MVSATGDVMTNEITGSTPRIVLSNEGFHHEAAMRIADLGLNKSRHKTRDLVNLLLCHGARAWRSNQPEAKIHLHIMSKSGRGAIHLRLR
jgi:hypothetical protein